MGVGSNVYFPTTGVSEGKKIVVYRTSSSSSNIIVNSQTTIVINQYQTLIFVYTNGMWVSQSGEGDNGDGSYSGGEGTSDAREWLSNRLEQHGNYMPMKQTIGILNRRLIPQIMVTCKIRQFSPSAGTQHGRVSPNDPDPNWG